MDLNKIEAQAKVVEQIRQLEKPIHALNKIGQLLANQDCDVKLNLVVTDLKKQVARRDKIGFDEDGSLIREMEDNRYRMYHAFGLGHLPGDFARGGIINDPSKLDADIHIRETDALEVIGLLIGKLYPERTSLYKKLV